MRNSVSFGDKKRKKQQEQTSVCVLLWINSIDSLKIRKMIVNLSGMLLIASESGQNDTKTIAHHFAERSTEIADNSWVQLGVRWMKKLIKEYFKGNQSLSNAMK